MNLLYKLRPGDIWRYLLTQPASFWWFCIYMFFEYVRPQQLFPVIDVLPWGQVTLGMTTLTLLLTSKRFRPWNIADTALTAFAAVILLSTITAYSPWAAIDNYIFFFSWALVYFLMTNIVVSEKRYVVFGLAFLLYNAQMSWGAMKQWASFGFGFRTWGVTGGAGWFNNSGEFGVAMCIFLPIALFFALGMRRRLSKGKFLVVVAMAMSALFGTIASSSRGALVWVAAVGMWLLLKSKYRVRTVVATAVIVAAVLFALPPEQRARFQSAGNDQSSVTRLTYWHRGLQMAREHPVLGVGYFNWLPFYQRNYGIKGQLPHNIFIQAMAELGYTGLAAFLALIGVTLVTNGRTRRRAKGNPEGQFIFMMAHGLDAAMIGFLASGFFVTVLYYPFFWINLSMTVSLHEVARRELAPVPLKVPTSPRRNAVGLARFPRHA